MQQFLFPVLRTALAIGFSWLLVLPATAAQPRTLLVFGDSISAAYGMSSEQGWVALLSERLEASHPDYTVVNASISGETTAGGLRRLPDLLQRYEPEVVVLELGGNDALRGYPTRLIRENLATMSRLSREAGAKVLLLPMEIPPNYGARYTRAFRESFPLVAKATGAHTAPFMLEGIATRDELMQDDGIHPTAAAQQQLLDNVLPSLLEIL
ncbi:arylesterase [Kineobactrum sediminis]|uniref:Arylesterase n=1 Tax=Kineobactrum sediminis TaxID=1905677 RepID=A0A2N5Y4D3_9GAMM|nr:arylesterase [Kineobactrum sediminis]PLW83250.1 arylesterase [Kineobactrum sediminis]